MNINEPIRNEKLLYLLNDAKEKIITKEIAIEITKALFLSLVSEDGNNKYIMAFTDWDEFISGIVKMGIQKPWL